MSPACLAVVEPVMSFFFFFSIKTMMKSLVFRANKMKSEIYKQTCLPFSKFIQDEYSSMKYWEHTNNDASGKFDAIYYSY